MAPVINIFEPTPEAERSGSIDLRDLAARANFKPVSDWSIVEAYVCLLLAAASVDGKVTAEEQGEIIALARRSRVLKSVDGKQLVQANAVATERTRNRPDGLKEACESLPDDMRLSIFAHCVDIVLADGALLPVEADFLNRITAYFNLAEVDARRVMEAILIKNRY
jgi:uncharacterized tellurite resistance protein B-like protein